LYDDLRREDGRLVITLTLKTRIPDDLRAEVSEKLPYASERLLSFEISQDGRSLDVAIGPGGDPAEVETKIRDLVTRMISGHRAVNPEEIYRHRMTPPNSAHVWESLVAMGLLAEEGPGQVALLGDASQVADALDLLFCEIARRAFVAVPHQYPTMLPMAALDRCHYFSSFPHHVTFAPHVREDVEAITHLGDPAGRGDDRSFLQHLATPAHALSPAVCFHTYLLLADRKLDRELTVTAKGRCFRFESKNMATLERSWDFSMREVIFVGPRKWVDEMRQKALREVEELVERLGLDAWIETANDPFFATNFVAKRYHQLMTQAKYELRLSLPYSGKSVAAASFNVHGDFFGRSFGIAHDEGFASTGCLAFGVERWVWSLFSQFGPNVGDWPLSVRSALIRQ
jgi:seryl-tRNA synthetase